MVPERLRDLETRGFTLTELIVVVALTGIITAVGMPFLLSYWRAGTVRAGAENMRVILNSARQMAIRDNQTVCVTNNGTTAQYHVGSCGAAAWTGPGTDAAGNVSLANNATVTSAGSACFTYLGAGWGNPAPPAPCTQPPVVYTVTANGQAMTVTVATTGRVSIP